jgi:ABC-type lipoprotein export system ATPase subunit
MIHLENVSKIYQTRYGTVKALNDVTFEVEAGEFVVVRGVSGCGKTTLLMTISGMQRPNSGNVIVGGNSLYTLSIRGRALFRAEGIGFVFQMFHLVPYLNVIENVLLAGGAVGGTDTKAEANRLLERLGLTDRTFHRPSELSAGEKQRTAIARALLNRPKIILADEPAGNLDPDNADVVLGHLADFRRQGGTVIVVTHGTDADRFADRTIYMHDGRIDNFS